MKPTFFKLSNSAKNILLPIKTINAKDVDDNFHEDGLFSTKIFGNMGSPERMKTFSYIPLNTELISPHIYHDMGKLSSFYRNILNGSVYATWNEELSIFEESTFELGKTGYAFFTKHMNDIKWSTTGSAKRDQKIAMLEKYKDVTLLPDLVVMPAGLRDIMIKNGKEAEDEVNPLYRKLIGLSYLLENSDGLHPNSDGVRLRMQNVLQEIYKHIITLNDGKNGFIQGKWTKRNILGGTRNVITASVIKVKDARKDKSLGLNDSIVGLYQYAYGIYSKLDFLLRTTFVDRLLGDGSNERLQLVNPKTGKFESVQSPSRDIAKFMTIDGLESKVVKKLKVLDYTHSPVMVGKYYLANIYDDGSNIRVMFDNRVPEGFDEKHIRPLTIVDMLSIATLKDSDEAIGMMTRYPIAEQGSIYPTKLYVKPTVTIRNVNILNDNWDIDYTLSNYPDNDSQVYTAMAVHHSKLANLGADHDGDKLSLTVILSSEAKEQIAKLMNSTIMLVRPDGSWVNSLTNTITSHVLKSITRGNV